MKKIFDKKISSAAYPLTQWLTDKKYIYVHIYVFTIMVWVQKKQKQHNYKTNIKSECTKIWVSLISW